MADETDGRGPSVRVPGRRSCLVHCDPGADGRPGTRGVTPSCHRRRRGRRRQRLCVAVPAHCDRPLPHVAVRRQACCRPTDGSARRRRHRSPGRWPERTAGRAVTTTGPPQFQQVGSAPPGASASCPATSQQRQVQLVSIRQSTGPSSPSVIHMCHPRWDVGQRGARAPQRPPPEPRKATVRAPQSGLAAAQSSRRAAKSSTGWRESPDSGQRDDPLSDRRAPAGYRRAPILPLPHLHDLGPARPLLVRQEHGPICQSHQPYSPAAEFGSKRRCGWNWDAARSW